MGDARKRKTHMSAKTLIIAAAALAASTAMTVPSFAAGGDGTGPTGAGPGNPPAATQQLPVRATVMFNLLDTNHDGAVDKDEFAAITNATFAALDDNDDSKLTPDELRSHFGAMMGQRGGRGPGDRGGPGMQQGRNWQDRDDRGGPMGRMAFNGGPAQWGAGYGPQGGPPSFADLDTNHDGAISQDEFQAHIPAPGQGYGRGPQR
jgi:hypothetical protein